VPVYALLAGADAVVDNRVVVETLSRSRAPVRIERFEGAGHMLTASLPREELLRRFRDWLRSPPDAAPQLVEQRVSPFAGDGRPLPDPPDLEPPGA
jgi:GrpB-like predicted nucleotidyltransferase (UPF0157 family)